MIVIFSPLQIESVYTKQVLPKYGEMLNNSKIYAIIYFLCLKSYNIIYMGWCLTSFVFLKYERWITVFSAVNYFGFIYMLIWACMFNGYRYFLKSQPTERKSVPPVKQATD